MRLTLGKKWDKKSQAAWASDCQKPGKADHFCSLFPFTDSTQIPLDFRCAGRVLISNSELRQFDLARLSEVRGLWQKNLKPSPRKLLNRRRNPAKKQAAKRAARSRLA